MQELLFSPPAALPSSVKLMVPDLRNDDNFAYLLRNKTAQASHEKLFG
jgi:hypothetical protein